MGTEPGLVAYWPLDEGTGLIAGDFSTNSTVGNFVNMDNSNWGEGKIGGGKEVTLTVTGSTGSPAMAIVDVNVFDTIPPTAICQDITINLDATGNASITAADIDNGSFDACGIDPISIDITDFNCANVGANTVTLTVIDLNGNVSTCTSTVTVQDTIDPIAMAQDITLYLDASGNALLSANDIDNSSSDNCGIVTLTVDSTNFDCSDLNATSTIGDITLGTSNSNPGEDCANIKANNPAAANGVYWVDPDGAGGNAASQCYCDMTTDGGGWMLVAHQKPFGPFAPYNSNLNPNFSSGTYVANPIGNTDFYKNYNDVSHDQMMFAYGDMTKWLVLDPTCARANFNSFTPNCLVINSFNTARTAGQLTNVLNRSLLTEDPWIGGEGDHIQNINGGMLWGEAGWGPGTHGSHKNATQWIKFICKRCC